MADLPGVGPDAPRRADGKASESPYRFDLLQPHALAAVAALAKRGHEKYGIHWTEYQPNDHLNHAMQHIFAYLAGDKQEGTPSEHLVHAAWRILSTLDCVLLLEAEEEARRVSRR